MGPGTSLQGKKARLCIRRYGLSTMKGSPGALVASVLAASTAALASASGDQNVACHPWSSNSNEGRDPPSSGSEVRGDAGSSTEDKFAPRFDGLRFIETLVTAHR